VIKEKDKKKVKLDCEIAWKHMGTTDQCFESRRRMSKGLRKCQRFVQLKRLHHKLDK
jgi:hypothetical protein